MLMTVAEPAAIVVLGLPRSGTTWAAAVLGHTSGGVVRHEPDNEKEHLAALLAKRGLGRFPVIGAQDDSPTYRDLWAHALEGQVPDESDIRDRCAARIWHRRSQPARERAVNGNLGARVRLAAGLTRDRWTPGPSGMPIVKSVHAPLALDWLVHSFPEPRFVVVLRNPANVLSSWLEMRLSDADRHLDIDPRVVHRYMDRWGVRLPHGTGPERAAWQVCLLTAALIEAAEGRPEVVVVEHEQLCHDPVAAFAQLSTSLGLSWREEAHAFLGDSDRAGQGFEIRRVARDQPERWRSRLSHDGVDALRAEAAQFPHLERWARVLFASG